MCFPSTARPIENGVVTIDGERIVAVGKFADHGSAGSRPWRRRPLARPGQCPHAPGIQRHRQPLGTPACGFLIGFAVLAQRRGGSADPAGRDRSGLRESLASGVTTVGDIATAAASDYSGAPPIDITAFVECIGFSRARADSAFEATVERLEAFDQASDRQRGLSPHAPYTVSPGLLRRLMELAAARHLPVAMHVAESVDELELLDHGTGRFNNCSMSGVCGIDAVIPRGSPPLDYLQQLATAPRS